MGYTKMTLDMFIAKLKEGGYSGLTGARRAIGKSDWDEADKKSGNSAADKYFGDSKPAAKAASAEPKVAKKRGRKPGSGKKPASIPAEATPAATRQAKQTVPPPARAPRVARTPVSSLPQSYGAGTESQKRMEAAIKVMELLRNSILQNPLEEKALTLAFGEFIAQISKGGHDMAAVLLDAGLTGSGIQGSMLPPSQPPPAAAAPKTDRPSRAREPEPEADEDERDETGPASGNAEVSTGTREVKIPIAASTPFESQEQREAMERIQKASTNVSRLLGTTPHS
jgi:hypothetical protein